MKSRYQIIALTLLVVGASACAKHDFLDEDTITGKVGPEAYWEIKSSAITAGDSMQFTAQYYSSKEAIDHSEAWYNIDEKVEYTVICPWVTTFAYSKTSNTTEHKRISQFISRYAHSEDFWSDSLHAYTFTGYFPVSRTLSPVVWNHPSDYDADKMESYFGKEFMQSFRDELRPKMQFADYRNMFTGLALMENFKQYTDSALDPNAGEGVYAYFFPKDAEGNVQQWVLDSMDVYWNRVSFSDLILNAGNNYYDVDYKRSYIINAELRVFDEVGTYSKTVSKEITIN